MENKSLEIPELTTDRLYLEPLTIAHSLGMFEMWSKQEVCEYSGSAEDFDGNPIQLPAMTADDSDKIIDFFFQYQQRNQKVRWAMINKTDNRFVGALGFNTLGDCSEIAYHLDPRYWGQGFMAEACKAVSTWATSTMGATFIEAYIDPDNIASIKLIRRLGYLPTDESSDGADRYLFTSLNGIRSVPFRGDDDRQRLLDFLSAENQFAGNTHWDYGTSLKSAFCNLFDTFNYTPIHRLWVDRDSTIQAYSYICPNSSIWRFQSKMKYRVDSNVSKIVKEAEKVLALLTDKSMFTTFVYESRHDTRKVLEGHDYHAKRRAEVYMEMTLDEVKFEYEKIRGSELRLLNYNNIDEIQQRIQIQLDAFIGPDFDKSQMDWMNRTIVHQIAYNKSCGGLDVVAVDEQSEMCSFASIIFDHANGIAEFEPVGTLNRYQRQGYGKSVLLEGLAIMKSRGMEKAVVRTGIENIAAIEAYKSVGFTVTDYLIEYAKDN